MKASTRLRSALALVLLPLVGCATIANGKTQKVKISPYPGTSDVKITDEDGKVVYEGEAPAEVELNRGDDYEMTVTKAGYEPAKVKIESEFEGGLFVAMDMMFTFGVGIFLDFANSSMYEFDTEGVETTLFRPGKRPSSAD